MTGGKFHDRTNDPLQDGYVILAAIVVLAFIIRMIWVGNTPLWKDEVFSLVYARHSLAHHLDLNRTSDVHPPLYPVLLKLFVSLFGESRVATRALSALFGAFTIPAIYLIARNWLSVRIALISATFLILNPVHIHYSREMRAYAALSFCVLWATYFFLEVIRVKLVDRSHSMGRLAAFSILLALTFHLHYSSLLFFVLFGITAVVIGAIEGDWRKAGLLIGAIIIAAIICLPQSYHFINYAMKAGAARNEWIEPTNIQNFYANTMGAYPFAWFAKPILAALYVYGGYKLFGLSKPLFATVLIFAVVGPLLFAAVGLFKPIYLVRSIQALVLLSPLLLGVALADLRPILLVPMMAMLGVVHLWAAHADFPLVRHDNPGETLKAALAKQPDSTVFFDSNLDQEQGSELAAYHIEPRNKHPVDLLDAPNGEHMIADHLGRCRAAQARCSPTVVVMENTPRFFVNAGTRWHRAIDRLERAYPPSSDEIKGSFRFVTFP